MTRHRLRRGTALSAAVFLAAALTGVGGLPAADAEQAPDGAFVRAHPLSGVRPGSQVVVEWSLDVGAAPLTVRTCAVIDGSLACDSSRNHWMTSSDDTGSAQLIVPATVSTAAGTADCSADGVCGLQVIIGLEVDSIGNERFDPKSSGFGAFRTGDTAYTAAPTGTGWHLFQIPSLVSANDVVDNAGRAAANAAVDNTPPQRLALTGSEAASLGIIGAILLAVGLLYDGARRRAIRTEASGLPQAPNGTFER